MTEETKMTKEKNAVVLTSVMEMEDRNTDQILKNPRTRIRINVGGSVSETYYETLRRIPGTRLANLTEEDPHFIPEDNQYFFDRHPVVFQAILNLYRTGELHIHFSQCYSVIKRELDFWGIDELSMEKCCFVHYFSFSSQRETLEKFEKAMSRDVYKHPAEFKIRSKVWNFLDDPYSSNYALIYMSLTIFFIIVSIAQMILTTIASFKVFLSLDDWAFVYGITREILEKKMYILNTTHPHTHVDGYEIDPDATRVHSSLNYLNFFCVGFFTVEFLIRLIFAPNKKIFLTEGYQIVDFLTLVAGYVGILTVLFNPSMMHKEDLFDFVHNIQILRVFRLFRLMKYIRSLAVLLYTVKSSLFEVFISMVFLLTFVITFGSTIYFAESSNREKFPNIMVGIWWAIVTMTTVGYGDVVPSSTLGYFIGAFCAMLGILAVALTVPVIVTNATLFFSYVQYQPRNRTKVKLGMEMIDNESYVTPIKETLNEGRGKGKVPKGTAYVVNGGFNNNTS